MVSENPQFTVTFWIRVAKNRSWMSPDSTIRFPPMRVKGGISVYFVKYGCKFNVYVLHPLHGYRKLSANSEKYIGKDMFVAVTVDGGVTKLYLNGKLIDTVLRDEMAESIEPGDYVMASVTGRDLRNINISNEAQIIMPAEVKLVDGEEVDLLFFEISEVVKLPKNRLVL